MCKGIFVGILNIKIHAIGHIDNIDPVVSENTNSFRLLEIKLNKKVNA